MAIPHTCPVCSGRGQVPKGFYMSVNMDTYTPDRCRSCGGSGVVWEPKQVSTCYPPSYEICTGPLVGE